MYDERKKSCDQRIVSIHQPYVRPIKRGKARADTEFGPKISIAMVNGYADVTRLSWEAYNESGDLTEDIGSVSPQTLPGSYSRRFQIF